LSKLFLKLNMNSGASGDMFLGAFYSLLSNLPENYGSGLKLETLRQKLTEIAKSFGSEYGVSYEEVDRKSESALNITLIKTGGHNHSHHVTLATFSRILDKLESLKLIDLREREVASGLIDILAQAEAKAHMVSLEKVHFHEIGEEDSIFDIIAAAILIAKFSTLFDNITVVYDYVEIGHGFVQTSHGLLEIPAPATKNIIDEHALQFKHKFEGENLTPTGAAILAYLKPANVDLLEIEQVRTIAKGVGAGSRNPFDRPNILTLELLE